MDDENTGQQNGQNPTPSDDGGLSQAIQSQTAEARKILATLKSLTSNGEIHKTIFEELEKKIEGELSDIKTAKAANTRLRNELDKDRTEVTGFLDEARSKTGEIKTVLGELRTLQARLDRRSESIETIKTEVVEKKKTVTVASNAVKKLFQSADALSKTADKHFASIKKNAGDADEILKKLIIANKQAEQNAKNLQEYFEKGKKSFDRIEKTEKNIHDLFKDSQEKQNNIEVWYNKLFGDKGTRKKVEEIEKKIHAQQAEIDRQLADAAANRLCASFEKKVNELKIELVEWKNRTKRCVYALVVFNTVAAILSALLENAIPAWEHIAIVTPIVFLLIFSSLEYVKVKRFLEEYSSKYILAFAMPAYFELIEDRGGKQEALKYIVGTTDTIHQNVADKVLGKDKSKDTVFDYINDTVRYLFRGKGVAKKILENVATEGLKTYVETLQEKKKTGIKDTQKQTAEAHETAEEVD